MAALLIGIGVAWIVEPLLGFAMSFWEFGREHIAQFLPSSATNAVVNAVQNSPDEVRLEWWAAALVLAGVRRAARRVRHLAHDAGRHQLTRGPRRGRWTDVSDDGRCAGTPGATGRRRALHHSPCDGVPPQQRG